MNRGIVWCPHCGKPHPLGTKVCPVSAKSLERGVNQVVNAPVNPFIGMTLAGKYHVTKLLGSGGMGEVYEAENKVLKRAVALKIVRGGNATREGVARLERELLLVSAVQHPNICDVYDAGLLSDGSPFIVLERLFGETFAQLLVRKGSIALPQAVDVFTQILSGVQAAHGAQIVHRDLKPQNVFLADRLGLPPLVKLLDFGLARDLSGMRTRTLTKPGALLGTLKYMAPEQLRAQSVDARADIFAIGVMLYEALSGHHPFEGKTLADTQANILRAEATPLHTRARVPNAVSSVVMRALNKEPAQRWPAAVDMQRALQRAVGSGNHGETLAPPDDPPSSNFRR